MSLKFVMLLAAVGSLICTTDGVQAQEPPGGRVLQHYAIVHTSPEEAFAAFTTREGIESWMVPHAEVDFRVGGTIKTNYNRDGVIGDPGTIVQHVLSFEPGRMFSMNFTAPQNAPVTKIAEATWTVLRFDPLGKDVTRVSVAMMGYGTGPEWDAAYEHFNKGNAYTLKKLQERFPSPKSGVKTWTDAAVTVTAEYGAEKSQAYELIVPAPPADVWDLLTTVEGVKRFYPSNPEIEMVPGGKWDLHGGKPNKVLSFVPGEMLAVTGSAPPQFPNVMNGGMWGVFTFEPAEKGATRLTLSTTGWGNDEEWDAAFGYFEKNNPLFLNMIHRHFANNRHEATEPPSHEAAGRGSEKLTRRSDGEILVKASIQEVWRTLTTSAGLQTWAAPTANVELRIGGVFQLSGPSGDMEIGSKILGYLPARMLSYEGGSIPAPQPGNGQIQTWLVWQIEEVGGALTRVRLTAVSGEPVTERHLVYYFGPDVQLGSLERRFTQGPRVWPQAKIGAK